MQLSELPPSSNVTIFNVPLQAVSVAKIYYCHRGRNAYHGTWVTHYKAGCMHTTLETAKRFAEPQRTQGSVFYIKELPALLLSADRYQIAVTQINTDIPLGTYTAFALPEREGYMRRIAYGTEPTYLRRGMSLFELLRTFWPTSNFWLTPPPLRNSVVVLYSLEESLTFEEFVMEPLQLFESIPQGPDCYLGWRTGKNRVKHQAVTNLSALYADAV